MNEGTSAEWSLNSLKSRLLARNMYTDHMSCCGFFGGPLGHAMSEKLLEVLPSTATVTNWHSDSFAPVPENAQDLEGRQNDVWSNA